jgi:hypothetical protein
LYPPLRFASLYVALGTALQTASHQSPESLSEPRMATSGKPEHGPSLVGGFVKAFTFTSTCTYTQER